MVILDTNILSLLHYANSTEAAVLLKRLRDERVSNCCVTIISFEEQMRGWLAASASAKTDEKLEWAYERLRKLIGEYQRYPILDFDMLSIVRFNELKKRHCRIGTMDLRIAAVALAHDALLISRNLIDFQKVPGLRVEDWTQPVP